jgi:hypothetical protein
MPEELKGFTPVAPDRDAILFAAGQAAARRWAGWKWLTLGLVVSNAVTLGVMFWPRTVAPVPRTIATPDPSPTEPSEPYCPDPSSYIALRHGLDSPPVPADTGPVSPQSTPLTPRSLSDPRFN